MFLNYATSPFLSSSPAPSSAPGSSDEEAERVLELLADMSDFETRHFYGLWRNPNRFAVYHKACVGAGTSAALVVHVYKTSNSKLSGLRHVCYADELWDRCPLEVEELFATVHRVPTKGVR